MQLSNRKALLVFLHGFPDCSEVWGACIRRIEELLPGFSCLAIDLPGVGRNRWLDNVTSNRIDQVGLRLAHLVLEKSEGSPVHLVGHDFGGMVAVELASHVKDGIASLTLVNSPHPGRYQSLINAPTMQAKIFRYAQIFGRHDADELCSRNDYAALRGEYLDRVRVSDRYRDRLRGLWAEPGALKDFLGYYRDNLAYLSSGDMTHLRYGGRTQILWGEDDHALTLENLDGLEQWLSNVVVKRRAGLGHWSFLEDQKWFVEELATFVEST